MQAVASELIVLLKKLQSLESLRSFSLGGGTNLALRYHHRKSDDIDLFTDQIIGKEGFEKIRIELETQFGGNLSGFQYPCDENDQFIFARCFIKEGDQIIKVEILQNMKITQEIETIEDIRMISKIDIGLFKLVSASNRLAKKDIYDLDHITNEIHLSELCDLLSEKKNTFNSPEDRTVFDLDELCPLENPELLLKFDEGASRNKRIPNHSNDNIIKMNGPNWMTARYSWRSKVRGYYSKIGFVYQFNH